jgi:2-polyprenyl-3-methyl-5-hydroxy-6-metoxy-1,4-benzoquinol methylase
MPGDMPDNQAEHTLRTREAYDRLAAVWSSTTDEGPFNGLLERPALRALVPGGLAGTAVLDAGCGSGAQAQWLLDQGADVVAVGLTVDRVAEPQPSPEAVRLFPDDLGPFAGVPLFIVYRLWLQS